MMTDCRMRQIAQLGRHLKCPPFRAAHGAPHFRRRFASSYDNVHGGKSRSTGAKAFMFIIPVISFGLGCWQVQRLKWKVNLIEDYTNRLEMDPVLLPRDIDYDRLGEFDYRKVLVKGRLLHDLEIAYGPRVKEGESGYYIITPLERDAGDRILVNRGWVPTAKKDRNTRPKSQVTEDVVIEGLLRKKFEPNWVSLPNLPEIGQFATLDTDLFSKLTKAKPILVEATSDEDTWPAILMKDGIPVPRAPTLSVRNNHMQYIVTWYGLSVATTVMLVILLRKPPSAIQQRVKAAPF